jgi:hypothetical protein
MYTSVDESGRALDAEVAKWGSVIDAAHITIK